MKATRVEQNYTSVPISTGTPLPHVHVPGIRRFEYEALARDPSPERGWVLRRRSESVPIS